MNRPVSIKSDIESITFPNRKYQAHMGSLVNSTKHLRMKFQFLPSLLKCRHKRNYFLIHSIRPSIILKQPDKDITRREKYRPLSLMNIYVEILKKILANQIQNSIKRIIHHDQVDSSLGYKTGSTFENQCSLSHQWT